MLEIQKQAKAEKQQLEAQWLQLQAEQQQLEVERWELQLQVKQQRLETQLQEVTLGQRLVTLGQQTLQDVPMECSNNIVNHTTQWDFLMGEETVAEKSKNKQRWVDVSTDEDRNEVTPNYGFSDDKDYPMVCAQICCNCRMLINGCKE